MANEVILDPRFLKYNKENVEDLLDKVNNADEEPTEGSGNMISSGAVKEALGKYVAKEDLVVATEEDVRGIVRDYTSESEE